MSKEIIDIKARWGVIVLAVLMFYFVIFDFRPRGSHLYKYFNFSAENGKLIQIYDLAQEKAVYGPFSEESEDFFHQINQHYHRGFAIICLDNSGYEWLCIAQAPEDLKDRQWRTCLIVAKTKIISSSPEEMIEKLLASDQTRIR